MTTPDHFIFIVDTDHYAGNFERPMCAYMTGEIGECGVGDKAEKVFREEVKNNPLVDDSGFSLVIQMPTGDYPCMRPCEIYPNPNWFNHGMGEHFRRDDPDAEKKALESHIKAVKDYYEPHLQHALDRKEKPLEERGHPSWTDEALEREIERNQKKISDAENATSVSKYPAYTSVAIFLEKRPTDEQIQFLKDRANKFVEYCKTERWLPDNLAIEGFRLVEVKVNHYGEEI